MTPIEESVRQAKQQVCAERVAMKERPILFSGEMVRAILDGRKTQTRRVIRLPKHLEHHHIDKWAWPGTLGWQPMEKKSDPIKCPYGQPGDRLWVRETWRIADMLVDGYERDAPYWLQFHADAAVYGIEGSEGNEKIRPAEYQGVGENGLSVDSKFGKWRPSIHMPRWASRVTLEIVDVRVERLQNISEKDVHSEGILERGTIERLGPEMRVYYSGFADYWDFENAKRGFPWDSNPWVWVVEFKKL